MALKVAARERRHRARARRRVGVRYGSVASQHLGYTSDLGDSGLFLQGNQLYPPDTILYLDIDEPEGTRRVRGIVRWVKEVPPAFRRSLRGGMGIEFLPED
jgi:hypothetical protein